MIQSVEYLPDSAVSENDNQQLINLLSICFTGPGNEMFKSRRYYRQSPAHRMVLRNDQGVIVAHVAGHDRLISSDAGELRVLGIAEVAVHPDYRGKGLSKKILAEFETWAGKNGFSFSVLFGDPKLYGPQGYFVAVNLAQHTDAKSGKQSECVFPNLQYKSLGGLAWPRVDIRLGGMIW